LPYSHNIQFDELTYEAVYEVAVRDYDGNFSMAVRKLVEKALGEDGLEMAV